MTWNNPHPAGAAAYQKRSPAEAGGAHERRPVPVARMLATIHPSAVLRADDRDTAFAGLVADLTVAARALTA